MKKLAPNKICLVLGTRPEIIKLSPVICELERRKISYFIIHTNQHYAEELDGVFFRELGIKKPKYNLGVGSKSHVAMIAEMLSKIEKVLLREKPHVVLVQGDTNSVLAGALASAKLEIPTGHVEAGLRSYDRTMPEELNRVLADHVSDLLFAPTVLSKRILLGEGVAAKQIFVTGNTVVDAVKQNIRLAKKKSGILKELGLKRGKYALLTLHRPSNVDYKLPLAGIMRGLQGLEKLGLSNIIFPVHPRTGKQLAKFKIKLPGNVRAVRPLGYLDTLLLINSASIVLTDSGGIQEEACVLKVPCITLRKNTERPETLGVGSNVLAGTDPGGIFRAVRRMLKKPRSWKNPFGDGKAGKRIIEAILNFKHWPKV